jgi:WD40 repeat protein/serine/threonine protein kinase
MENTDRLIEILEKAESRFPGADRDGFLADACAGDLELKDQVISLLKSHESAGDFLMNTVISPASLVAEELGDLIGRYRLLEKLGEGGCGVVYVAEQTEPVRRRVALKVIKLGMDTKQVIARFEAERQALALMDHPNIAKVLDAGATDTGRPYFVMELVRGIAITHYCDQNNVSTNQRLELFIKVCSAIQHAHQKGIIHRDIKPSNILVTLHDGVPVPRVIDFGIAKAIEGKLTDATIYTQLLHFVGTPAYMSPEQAEMSGLDIDTRSDIYSLGVLLYELLTGNTPFDGQRLLASGIDAMRKTIRETEPTRPSTKLRQTLIVDPAKRGSLSSKSAIPDPHANSRSDRRASGHKLEAELGIRSAIHNDLDWIVMKCLEKDRSRRYETANGLAADLQRHLSNEPVAARPPSTAYKLHKAWRRNKIAWTAAAAVSIALVVGISLTTWQAIEARHHLYVANMNLAGQAWERNNFMGLRQLLEETRSAPERGFEWYYWQRQAHLYLKALRGHVGPVKSVMFSPDGQRLVTGGGDKTVKVWKVTTGQELFTLKGHESSVNCVAFSPDGQRIVSASSDHTVRFWDATTGREMSRLTADSEAVSSVAFSGDGQRIVTGGDDQTAKVWEVATSHLLITLTGHTGTVNCASFSPDGKTILTGSDDRTARVWQTASGKEQLVIPHEKEVISAVFSPDGLSVITGGIVSEALMWDAITGSRLPISLRASGTMTTLAISSDGKRIVSGSWDSTTRLWNATNGHFYVERIFLGHAKGVFSVAISPDGTRIATAAHEGSAKIWEANDVREVLKVEGTNHEVLAVTISPDGERIATASGRFEVGGSVSGSGDQAVQVWDAKNKNRLRVLDGHKLGVSSVAFSPDGYQILTGSGDKTARLWDAATGHLLHVLEGHAASVSSVAFFPDGARIVTASHDQSARVWDAATGRELFMPIRHAAPVSSVAVSPDGKRILTGSFDGTAMVWEAASGQFERKIETPLQRISSVAFSPDSRWIVAAGWGNTPMVWDLSNAGREPILLKGHASVISSCAFSPDGRRIVSGSFDETAIVWESATGREVLRLSGHASPVNSVVFSPDGRRIITSGSDQTVRVWSAATPNQVAAWDEEERAGANSGTSR